METTQSTLEEIARLIIEGNTGGQLGNDEDGTTYWGLKLNTWSGDED